MKTVFIICSMFLIGVTARSQIIPEEYSRHSNGIYLSYQPADHGLGLRVDYSIGKLNLYNSASYGTWGVYKEYGVRDHMKLTQGFMIRIPDYMGFKYYVTGGLNYHEIFNTSYSDFEVDAMIFNHWSFELGFTCKLKRIAIAVATDIPRWEPCVYLGIPLRWTQRSK